MKEPINQSKRLGRGLGALITPRETPTAAPPNDGDRLRDIPLHLIASNPYQPRRDFDDAALQELEESIKANGLLQPVTVRPRNDQFELIAGERRVRAARRLGWSTIPALVREISDREHLQLALVENLQRENLNPIDEAEGYRQLCEEFAYSQQDVAEAVGKDRSTIANALRVLNLPESVREMVRAGKLSAGHARPLLALPTESSMLQTAQKIVASGMTVRAVERLTLTGRRTSRKPRQSGTDAGDSAEARRITDRLRRYLQTDVHVVADEHSRGELRIRFYSADDLERLLELITGPREDES